MLDDDEPPVSAEYAIKIALELDDADRLEFLQAWHYQRFLDALTA
jgi:hypothetical protein